MLFTTPRLVFATSPGSPRDLSLPLLFWHGVELSWKLSCTPNGPLLDEVRRIRVHRQNIQTGVVNNVVYDTDVANTLLETPRHVHATYIPRIIPRLPLLRWHVVGMSLKLWCTPNGPVHGEIRRMLVRPQNNQAGIVNKPKIQ